MEIKKQATIKQKRFEGNKMYKQNVILKWKYKSIDKNFFLLIVVPY